MGKGEGTKITARGVDPEVWKQVRLKSVGMGIATGQIVTEALRDWLEKSARKE